MNKTVETVLNDLKSTSGEYSRTEAMGKISDALILIAEGIILGFETEIVLGGKTIHLKAKGFNSETH